MWCAAAAEDGDVGEAGDEADAEAEAEVGMSEGGLAGCPGPTGAVWRWNFTNVQRVLRWMHFAGNEGNENRREGREEGDSPQGLHPSHGRLLCTHWSHACLDVVAREACESVPRRRPVPEGGWAVGLG